MIGRAARGITLSAADYLAKIRTAQALGIRVKINTVVNQANAMEDFREFIRAARPRRWKIFQATRIAEENGADFDRWAVSEALFRAFELVKTFTDGGYEVRIYRIPRAS